MDPDATQFCMPNEPTFNWGDPIHPPEGEWRSLVLELDVERLGPVVATASTGDVGSDDTLDVTQVERSLVVTPRTDDGGGGPTLGRQPITIHAEAPRPNVVRVRWSIADAREPDAWSQLAFPSARRIFETRRREVEEARQRAASDDERWDVCFRVFLEEWDRETYVTEGTTDHWTDLATGRSLDPVSAAERRAAIEGLMGSLVDLVPGRAKGDAVPLLEDTSSLRRMIVLHEQLFDRLGASFGALEIDRLARSFIRFGAAGYRRVTPVDGAEYLGATPTSAALLVVLPELVDQASRLEGARAIWTEMRSSVVCALAAYAMTHRTSARPTLHEYDLGSHESALGLEQDQIEAANTRFEDYDDKGLLELHWQNVLQRLAPGSFPRSRSVGWMRGIDAYFRPLDEDWAPQDGASPDVR